MTKNVGYTAQWVTMPPYFRPYKTLLKNDFLWNKNLN